MTRRDQDNGSDDSPETHDEQGLATTEFSAQQVSCDKTEYESDVVDTVEEGEVDCIEGVCASSFVVGAKHFLEGWHRLGIGEGRLVHAEVDLGDGNEGTRIDQSFVEA